MSERLLGLRDAITTKAFAHWWCHALTQTGAAVPHLDAALAAAGRARGRLVAGALPAGAGLPVRGGWLAAVARALGAAGGTLPLPGCLAVLLGDAEDAVRGVAARGVGLVGPAATTPEILTALTGMLRDPDQGVPWAAADALGSLGPAAATPGFLATLTDMLRDPEYAVHSAAEGRWVAWARRRPRRGSWPPSSTCSATPRTG